MNVKSCLCQKALIVLILVLNSVQEVVPIYAIKQNASSKHVSVHSMDDLRPVDKILEEKILAREKQEITEGARGATMELISAVPFVLTYLFVSRHVFYQNQNYLDKKGNQNQFYMLHRLYGHHGGKSP